MAKRETVARVTLPASLKRSPKDAKLAAGRLSQAERVEITVRVRRKAGAGTPTVGAAPLTREEFREAYGADPADIQKIEDFANTHGLDVVQSSVSQRTVRLSATVAAMQVAFGVQLKSYQMTKSKQRFRGRTGTISVPKDLASVIEGVFGLDNRPQARPHFHVRSRKKGFQPRADAAKPMTPLQVTKLYNFPAKLDGRGQCIAILELGGGFRTKDLTAYFKNLGITKPNVTAVSVGGAHNEPDGPTKDANGEVMLDIEVAGAVAPGAAIAVYFGPNTDEGFSRRAQRCDSRQCPPALGHLN